MYMIMWELSDKSISAEDVNLKLSKYNLPPLATPDSSTRTFRQSWRKFSSLHTDKYQTHMLTDNSVAIVNRAHDGEKLNLTHLGTIEIKEHSRGNVGFYYVCLKCKHYNSIKSATFTHCECGEPIAPAVQDIAAVFRKRLDSMSPEGRSIFYVQYAKSLLTALPFMSTGRPYVFMEKYKDIADSFANAMNEIGDNCYLLDINNNEDAGKIVRAGISNEIKTLKDRYEKLTSSSETIRERRFDAIKECRSKIQLYKDVLGTYTEELNKMADDFTDLVRRDLQSPQLPQPEVHQAPDSAPSECPSS